MEPVIIEGTLLPYAQPAYLTTTKGDPIVLELDGGEYSRAVLDSLSAYVAAVRPPLLREHRREGVRYGDVMEVFRGDDPDTGEDSIRVRIAVDPGSDLNPALVKRLSGYFAPDATDSAGNVYRMGLAEVSAVAVPMVDIQQGDVRIAASAWFSPGGLLTNVTSGGQSPVIAASVPQEKPMTKEELIALLADADVLAALKAALTPAPAPAPEVEVEMTPPAPPAAAMAPMVPPSPVAAAAAEIRAAVARAYDEGIAAAAAQHRGALAAGIAAAGRVTGGVGNPTGDVNDRAAQIAREKGVSFRDALKAAIAAKE